MAENEIQKTDNNPVRAFFTTDGVKKKFEELLGNRASAFLTSLLQIVQGNDTLKNCDQVSLFNAAATAATLDLPINPNLGFAWIVPYKGKAQFQMGYKGFIQLAQRTGQYSRIVAAPIYKNQFKSWNAITEDLLIDNGVEGKGDVVGYVAFFRLINGYEKVTYWTSEKVWNHAKKYSKSLGDASLWKTDFESMALKTVIKNMLSKWGILSIEMQTALKVDQAVIHDAEATDISYPDNEFDNTDKANKATDTTLDAMKGVISSATKK